MRAPRQLQEVGLGLPLARLVPYALQAFRLVSNYDFNGLGMDSKPPSLPAKASLFSYPLCEVKFSSLLLIKDMVQQG